MCPFIHSFIHLLQVVCPFIHSFIHQVVCPINSFPIYLSINHSLSIHSLSIYPLIINSIWNSQGKKEGEKKTKHLSLPNNNTYNNNIQWDLCYQLCYIYVVTVMKPHQLLEDFRNPLIGTRQNP